MSKSTHPRRRALVRRTLWTAGLAPVLLGPGSLVAQPRELDSFAASATQKLEAVRELEVGLARTSDGVELARLRDTATGTDFLAPGPKPLFRVHLRGADGELHELDSRTGWGIRLQRQGDCEVVNATGRGLAAGLVVTISLCPDEARVVSTLQLSGELATGLALTHIDFPIVPLGPLGDGADDVLIIPEVSGRAVANPWEARTTFSPGLAFPNGWSQLQLLGLKDQRTGLMLAVDDQDFHQKRLVVENDGSRMDLVVAWGLPDLRGTVDYRLPGRQALTLARGSTVAAVAAQHAWQGMPTCDGPNHVHDIGFWLIIGCDPSDQTCLDATVAKANAVGVPTAVHWYNWHTTPFDVGYPHFFPAKNGFAEAVRWLQGRGIKVMPYINAHLWDRNAADYPDRGLACAVKQRDGSALPFNANLVRMCSASQAWQEVVVDLVGRLVREGGVDGVYLDQLGAMPPYSCFDPSHAHPPGGGSWWVHANQGLFGRLRAEFPTTALIGEGQSPAYSCLQDGNLAYPTLPNNQPFYQAVAGQWTTGIGRGNYPTAYLPLQVQGWTYGDQPGWTTLDLLGQGTNLEVATSIARQRWAIRDIIQAGRLMDAPRIVLPDASAPPSPDLGVRRDVLATLWQGERGAALLLGNATDTRRLVRLEDPAVIRRACAGRQIVFVGLNGAVNDVTDPDGLFPLTLEPYATAAVACR